MSVDRHSNGEQWTTDQIAAAVYREFTDWRAIRIVATILAESGGWTWIRPMVLTDGPAHLSTDRGICQFNSYWWAHVPDSVAFNPDDAIDTMCAAVKGDGWEIDLDPWHGSKSEAFYRHLPAARAAVNALRTAEGLKEV